MPVAELKGCSLYYEDSDPEQKSNLPAAIFLHGAAGSAASWWQQWPSFKRHYRCIAYDARGYHRSTDDSGAGMDALIEDLEAFVDYLKLTKVSLIAQSMGGRAAIGFAVRNPTATDALVMCNTWGAFDWPAHWKMAEHLSSAPKDFEVGPIKGLSKRFQDENPELATLFESQKNASLKPKPKLGGAQPGGPTLEEVTRLTIPLLCITSNEDAVIPSPLVEGLATAIAGAECVSFSGVGHSAYFEVPGKFNEAVLAFLSKHTQAPATTP